MKEELKEELEKLTRKMDIPVFRRSSVPWLQRNMAIRNSEHPNFEKAKVLVLKLFKMGVR